MSGKNLILVGVLLSTLCFTRAHASDDPTAVTQFAASSSWRRALFYRPHSKGWESLVVSGPFFAAGNEGRTQPEAELRAELDLFRSRKAPRSGPASPQCRFPFRYKMLKKQFQLPELPECEAFSVWLKKYQPTGLSLVFASQYISNPSSAFGHSFLLATSDKQVESFWQTFNYAAAMPDEITAFSYAWGGITGWYAGDFTTMPFYQRLFYYGNVENRDLWLYPVKLTADQLDLMLRLLWEEVNSARFTYYFFDENCAGVLLRTFAAVFSDSDFGEQLPLYVAPVEAVKTLERHHMLEEPRLIPSQYAVLRHKYRSLNSKEQRSFRDAVDAPDHPVVMIDLPVTEAVMEYTAYVSRQNKGEIPEEFKELEKRAFLQRARYGVGEATVDPAPLSFERAPHLAHDGMAAEAGVSLVKGHTTGDVGWRVAMHGLEDPDAGFLEHSTFEFLKAAVSVNDLGIWLKDLTLINIENFVPYWEVVPQITWRANVHLAENLLNDSPTSDFFEGKFSVGTSYEWGSSLVYLLGVVSLNAGANLPQGHYEAGPELGYRWGNQSLRIFGFLNPGYNLFETSRSFMKAGGGLAISLSHSYELIQENQYVELTTMGMRGYRSGLSVRAFF